MKKILSVAFAIALMVSTNSCNNDAKDSVEKADSANEVKSDSSATKQTIKTDEESTGFLVKAANAGLTEVEAGKIAKSKSSNNAIKEFADMMINDHSSANAKVKELAAERNISLPMAPDDDKMKEIKSLQEKSTGDFDKAYVDAMVKGHKDVLDLFKTSSTKVNDAAVKTFIDNTIPVIQKHLDKITEISKMPGK